MRFYRYPQPLLTWLSSLYSEQLMQLYCARQRRRLNRGLRRKQQSLLKRLRKAKKEAPPMEKPEVVKTHLRDMVILPEMVGSMVGVYNGKTFNQVEIKVSCSWSERLKNVYVNGQSHPLLRLIVTVIPKMIQGKV